MNHSELKALTHATDSYKITTRNEKEMGHRIDKDLAQLETFFGEDSEVEPEDDSILMNIDRTKLVKI